MTYQPYSPPEISNGQLSCSQVQLDADAVQELYQNLADWRRTLSTGNTALPAVTLVEAPQVNWRALQRPPQSFIDRLRTG